MFCNGVLESIDEDIDYDEENKSKFEMITNIKRQKLIIGLHHSSALC